MSEQSGDKWALNVWNVQILLCLEIVSQMVVTCFHVVPLFETCVNRGYAHAVNGKSSGNRVAK